MPSDGASRMAALVVAPGISEASIRRELALRIDAAFLPRPLRLVDALPRNAAGKLPLDALRETLARAPHAPRTLTAQMRFGPDHPSLAGHFPDRPIVPGVVLLASVEDVLHRAGLRVVGCTRAKFFAPVAPGEALALRVDIGDGADAQFEITASGNTVAAGVLRCAGGPA